jgi:hypothetical protein
MIINVPVLVYKMFSQSDGLFAKVIGKKAIKIKDEAPRRRYCDIAGIRRQALRRLGNQEKNRQRMSACQPTRMAIDKATKKKTILGPKKELK